MVITVYSFIVKRFTSKPLFAHSVRRKSLPYSTWGSAFLFRLWRETEILSDRRLIFASRWNRITSQVLQA